MIAALQTEHFDELTLPERKRLRHLESVVTTGFKAYLDAGRALNEIRESRLYREDGTFEEYLALRWNLKPSRAYQLMDAANVVEGLVESSTIVEILPNNEAQCRELSRVEPEKRPEVWQEALQRTDGKPTAKVIRDVAEQWEGEEPAPVQRHSLPLFQRPDLTEVERALRDELEYADDVACPTWEQINALLEQFGEVLSNEEAQKKNVLPFGALKQVVAVVSRPELNGGQDFPIRLFSREHAWRFYQENRDRYLEFGPWVPESASAKNERVENDYYPTPEAITRPLLHLGCIKGQVFEPCAGSGDIAKLFDGCITNELYPRPEFEPDLIGDASDPELWMELERMGGTDWTVGNTPYGMELPTKILELAAQHSREGVALLLRLGFIEPCQGRRELLARLADNLRYVIPVNPRPQFRKDTDGTDNVTVAWFVWDFTWSWEDQLIDCPFKFLTDWKEAT